MIKDVMVHLDGSPEDEIRLEHGQAIAATDRAHLIGVLTNPLPDLSIAMPFDGGPGRQAARASGGRALQRHYRSQACGGGAA